MRRSWAVVAWGMVAAGSLLVGACSLEPASKKELAAERALADSLVKGFTPSSPESLAKRVVAARRRTDEFLTKHRDDVPAALLFVQLRVAETALTPQDPAVDSAGVPLDHFEQAFRAKKKLADCLSRLDHAIGRQPKNAELYYWKSLVLGLYEPIFGKLDLDPQRSQLPAAVEAAAKAVAIAPDSANYRTALAGFQMLSGADAAALKTLREGKNPHDPTLRLLEEWGRLPIPSNAVMSLRESAGIAEWLGATGLDDAHARIRAYWVPGSADSLRAYYSRIWKGIYWMKQPSQKSNDETWSFSSAAILFDGDSYRGLSEQDIKQQAMAHAEGISLQIREVRNPQAKTREVVPFDAGPVVCEMLLTNHRRVR